MATQNEKVIELLARRFDATFTEQQIAKLSTHYSLTHIGKAASSTLNWKNKMLKERGIELTPASLYGSIITGCSYHQKKDAALLPARNAWRVQQDFLRIFSFHLSSDNAKSLLEQQPDPVELAHTFDDVYTWAAMECEPPSLSDMLDRIFYISGMQSKAVA